MIDDIARRYEWIFLDAGFTLIAPEKSVGKIYFDQATELGRELGFTVDRDAFRSDFRDSWSRLGLEYRRAHPDGSTSEARERESWFRFTHAVAASHPELLAHHEAWHQALVSFFDRPDSWSDLDGVIEFLTTLDAQGVRMGVVSNWHRALHAILRDRPWRPHLAFVLTSVDAGYKKPSSPIFEQALALADVRPERVLHIGDSLEEDVRGASNQGLGTAWLTRGTQPSEEERSTADYVVNAIRDFLNDPSDASTPKPGLSS